MVYQPIQRFLWVVTRGFHIPEQKRRGDAIHVQWKFGIVYNYSGEAVKASIIINLSAYFSSFYVVAVVVYCWKGTRELSFVDSIPFDQVQIYTFTFHRCVYPVLQKKFCSFFRAPLFLFFGAIWSTKSLIFSSICWITFEEIAGIEIRIFLAWFSKKCIRSPNERGGKHETTKQMPLNVC